MSTTPRHDDTSDEALTDLTDVLTRRDVGFLRLLDGLAARTFAAQRPRSTLFDLEVMAHVIDGDQPSMVHQPIVDLTTGEVRGYEARARFDLEPRCSPDVWFARARRVGLGLELELKAVQAGLEALSALPRELFVTVNVSARTLCSPQLRHLLAGVPGARVVVEVTEHELVEDYEAVNDAVGALRAHGFRLAVDDAGTGCAGLGHILKLTPDVIKLDKLITSGIDVSPRRRAIAAAVVALARHWGSIVVAEGIETAAELEVLRAIGVGRGQGYFLGRPAPIQTWLGAA